MDSSKLYDAIFISLFLLGAGVCLKVIYGGVKLYYKPEDSRR